MDRYGCSKGYEEKTEKPVLSDEYRTIQKGQPDHAYCDYLYLKRYGLIFHEIADIRAELRMVQQPVIELSIAAQEKGGCKKQKRRRRQDGEENAEDAESQ